MFSFISRSSPLQAGGTHSLEVAQDFELSASIKAIALAPKSTSDEFCNKISEMFSTFREFVFIAFSYPLSQSRHLFDKIEVWIKSYGASYTKEEGVTPVKEAQEEEVLTERQKQVVDYVFSKYCDLGEMEFSSLISDVVKSKLPIGASGVLHSFQNSPETKEFYAIVSKRLVYKHFLGNKPLMNRVKAVYKEKGSRILSNSVINNFVNKILKKPFFAKDIKAFLDEACLAKPKLNRSELENCLETRNLIGFADLIFKD
ncbi:MAG: hypothetical protein S4CHLAM37_14450 [Chlamydiia bacterium]|nr:hypothetical protein [Chlamydiia bacterium]